VPQPRLIRGRVLHVSAREIYLARGTKILRSKDGGDSWELHASLPVKAWERWACRVSLLSRLLRLGTHHLVLVNDKAVVLCNKDFFLLEKDTIVPIGQAQGSRPLVLCSAKGSIYYGEYRSNPERSPVHIYRLDPETRVWSVVWTFADVRHVHGVFFDPYSNSAWVTTGDLDAESAIWRSDDEFRTLTRIRGGSQKFRAVQLLFSASHVYFGSDAPNEQNYIYRMDRAGRSVETLAPVDGSVFYGCQVGGWLYFSTAVEPSDFNTGRNAEVWCSSDGVRWAKFLEFRKDRLPLKMFQYGQVLFPSGDGGSVQFYCTPFATRQHGVTLVLKQEISDGQQE
jgi:hypothetical protein